MKTARKQARPLRTRKLAPARVRAATARLPKASRVSRPAEIKLPSTGLAALSTNGTPPAPKPSESSGRDMLQLYLHEIGQVKLLTPAEEIVLAKRIKRGDKRAREHMINANLRLRIKI